MKMIINCDDLGASKQINDSIFALMQQGRVTSATLMMNGPGVEDAIGRMSQFCECSFGVHLNLTEFSPLSSHSGLRPLLDSNGTFDGVLRRSPRKIPLTHSIREGVYVEWCAQIERALSLGVPVSHIDSHHHVHTRLGLLGVLKRVRQRFGIRRVRLRPNLSSTSQRMSPLRRSENLAWNYMLRHYGHAITTDGFSAFSIFHERLQAGRTWRGTIELMCHPGRIQFAAENELLGGNWRDGLPQAAQLISYNGLG